MPRIHPKPDALRGMLGLLPEPRRRALRHTWECPFCRRALEADGPREGGKLPRIHPGYDRLVDGILDGLGPRIRHADRERSEAPLLLAELLRHEPRRREILVVNARRFRSFSLCLLLLDRCREVSPEDPRSGEQWAFLALRVADVLDPEVYGAGLIEDLRARGWSLVAHTLRIAGDLLGAERAFEKAEKHLRQGTRDCLVRASVLVCKAVLRRAQRRLPEAERLLRRALSIWLWAGESRRAVEAMLSWSVVYREKGEPERAIQLLREACGLPASLSDPLLAVSIYHNIAACLVDAGKLLEAEGLLLHNRDLYEQLPEIRLRGQWLRGLLARELGRTAEAEALLTDVRENLLDQGITFDAALATLHIALLRLETGREVEAEALAGEAFAVFTGLGVEREALAAFLVSRRARHRVV